MTLSHVDEGLIINQIHAPGCGIARPGRPGCLNRFGDHGLTMPAFAWRSARPAAPAFSDHCPAPSADCQGEPVVPFQPAARPLLGARRPRDRRAESVHSCGGSRRRKCKNAPAPRCPAAGNAARQCGPAGGAGFPDRCRRHGRRQRRTRRAFSAWRPARSAVGGGPASAGRERPSARQRRNASCARLSGEQWVSRACALCLDYQAAAQSTITPLSRHDLFLQDGSG